MKPQTIFYLLLTLIVVGLLAEFNYRCNPAGMLRAMYYRLKLSTRIFIDKTVARIL